VDFGGGWRRSGGGQLSRVIARGELVSSRRARKPCEMESGLIRCMEGFGGGRDGSARLDYYLRGVSLEVCLPATGLHWRGSDGAMW